MRRRSLVDVKAHLSEIVDAAEHHGARVLILRHGKPAAAIVPTSEALSEKSGTSRPRRPTAKAIEALLRSFGKANPRTSAVADLMAGRR